MGAVIDEVKEVYKSRNFLRALVFRNLFGSYKNSVLGFAWHFFSPVLMLIVYYLAFTYIRESTIPDNWLFIASGLFVFHFILVNITQGSGAVISQGEMVKKMYFPRMIIPLANVISTFVVCIIGYLITIIIALVVGHAMDPLALTVFPLAMVLAFVFSTGCVLLFSSITVFVRDVHYLLSAVSMAFFFMTPMYFIAKEITGTFEIVLWCNPLTYFVEMCHDSLYWGVVPEFWVMAIATLISFAMLVVGAFVFVRLEKRFAERL